MSKISKETLADRYFLIQEHQAGGMATVYKAMDLESGLHVAVKRFDREKNLDIEAEAYRREVEALRNVVHPNIIRILDSGEDATGKPFLVLEWMSHDLLEHKKRQERAFDGWDDFAEQVALPLIDALAHAHANDLCHRDVSPENILVAEDGTIKLADFGISKLKRYLRPSITLNLYGKLPFAPPELDDGSFSYSRDVHAFGVLCLWGLSEIPLKEHKDIPPVLESADLIPDVRALIARCVSRDPEARPKTAGVVAHELARVQGKRAQKWAEQDRKRCYLRILPKPIQFIAAELGVRDEIQVKRFVDQDINDAATVARFIANRGTPSERTVPETYYVYGARASYQVAPDNRGADHFVLIGARFWEAQQLQRLFKEGSPSAPLSFDIMSRKDIIGAREAVQLLEQTLSDYEHQSKLEQAKKAEEAIFTTWKNVLDAKEAFERQRCAPVRFSSSHVNGRYVTLKVEGDLSGVEFDQPRCIQTDGKWIFGDVYEISGSTVVLYCPFGDLTKVPKVGQARLDTRAADVAIDRQRTATEKARTGGAVRGDLKKLLLDPGAAAPPVIDDETRKLQIEKDPFQNDALIAALSAPDALLVQGPPGTGKTRFIVGLVRNTLARNPLARILLTSQTHVAIDNALERLAALAPNTKMLRIARSGASVVAESCHEYLVDNQLDKWRLAVATESKKWLRDWSVQRGFDPNEIEFGSVLRRIGDLRQRISHLRDRIKESEEQLARLRRQQAADGSQAIQGDIDLVEREADENRVQLDSDKKFLEQLEKTLRGLRADADEYLRLPTDEIPEWSGLHVGESDENRRVASILDLHAEWLHRFGRDPSFLGALCERASVVAATCVGLASLPGAGEIPYDLCIVDEASKATATEAIVPMVRARRWILVGDSCQLPPFEDEIHRNSEIRRQFDIDSEEAAESLFERFRRLLPSECQRMLKKQYRMVPAIGHLISECFYKDTLGEIESDQRPCDARLVAVTGTPVTWITTRYLEQRRQERAGLSYVNPEEVNRILDLLFEFNEVIDYADEPVTVQLLSGYAAQVHLLEQTLDGSRHRLDRLKIECNTIDTVQGREADVVIFSVTRSSDDNKAGFLGEFARINVALSRAREALVVIGDDDFVRRASGADPLLRVIRHIEQNPSECGLQAYDAPGQPKGSRK